MPTKEQWAAYRKKHYDKNKERLKADKITCKCGGTFRRDYLPQHEKTKRHQTWVEVNS